MDPKELLFLKVCLAANVTSAVNIMMKPGLVPFNAKDALVSLVFCSHLRLLVHYTQTLQNFTLRTDGSGNDEKAMGNFPISI